MRCTTPLLSALALLSVSRTRSPPSSNRRFPPPSTTGKTSKWSSSSRRLRSSHRANVALPLTAMFLPGCCLSLLISPVRSPLTRVEFCHPALSNVEDTTTFGMLFIWSAIPPVCPEKKAANPTPVRNAVDDHALAGKRPQPRPTPLHPPAGLIRGNDRAGPDAVHQRGIGRPCAPGRAGQRLDHPTRADLQAELAEHSGDLGGRQPQPLDSQAASAT